MFHCDYDTKILRESLGSNFGSNVMLTKMLMLRFCGLLPQPESITYQCFTTNYLVQVVFLCLTCFAQAL